MNLYARDALRQASERTAWRLWTSGTLYRMTFATPVRCHPSVPNWKHTFTVASSCLLTLWRSINLFYTTLLYTKH